MSSDSGSGRHKPRRKATRARGTRPAEETAPPPPPEPPRYAPRDGESPFWANAQPRTDNQAWAETQARLEARNRTDSTPQYAPRPAVDSTVPLSTSSSGGWVTQTPAPTPTPAPTRRSRQSTPAEDLAGLGAWATTPPERPAERPSATPAPVERASASAPAETARWKPTKPETSRYDAKPAETSRLDSTPTSRYDAKPAETSRLDSTPTSRLDSTPTGRYDAAPAVTDRVESTPVTPNPSYTQPPVSAVADLRTARGTSELSGPRTAAIRETAERASRPARQAADSTAVDADGRPLSRTARGEGPKRRPLVAIAAVLLVITPISWILLHQPQNDEADASIPISRDDSYATPTTKPVDAPTTPPKSPKTPPVSPTAPPTGTPTSSVTPTAPPTGGPTDTPTTAPTTGTSTTPSIPKNTDEPRPTTTPTNTPPPPPPPPTDDGSMEKDELQLFNSINSARVNHGCQQLKRDSSLTRDARSDANERARNDTVNKGNTSSRATAGGDGMSASKAYDAMMKNNPDTVLDCSLTTMGVGRGDADYKTCTLLLFCSTHNRVGWVATFR
ncbi:hypothetical protein ACIA49_06095 [Kribbella sp. NPDC051587]|uniref:hypothetical protein n=1 Tax=Kribbella sp. NPDC051587 TaxID=3364119 RepID=UPI0037A7C805